MPIPSKSRRALSKRLSDFIVPDISYILTEGQTDKTGCVFAYAKLTEADAEFLESVQLDGELLLEIIDAVVHNGYSWKCTPQPEKETFKASITGTALSAMPMYCVTGEGLAWEEALLSCYYKMRKAGFPDAYRVIAKEKQPTKRFS